MIPDFLRIGHKLAAINFAKLKVLPSEEEHDEVRKQARAEEPFSRDIFDEGNWL